MRPRALILAALAIAAAPLRSIGYFRRREQEQHPPEPRRPAQAHAGTVRDHLERRPQRVAFRRSYAPEQHNGAREMERRRRQLERGDVLNWYPGQVRANWRG